MPDDTHNLCLSWPTETRQILRHLFLRLHCDSFDKLKIMQSREDANQYSYNKKILTESFAYQNYASYYTNILQLQ